MGASSTISNLQSALNCASKCDCCDKLQQQINAINAKIAGLKNVDENALKSSIKASLEPGISTAVAGGIAVLANRLDPQIKNLLNSINDVNRNQAATKAAVDEAARLKAIADAEARQKYNNLSELEKEVRDGQYAKNLAAQGYNKSQVDKLLTDAELARQLAEAKAQRQFQADIQAAIKRQAELDAIAARNAATNTVDEVARSAAQTAINDAAKASKTALDTANDVGGLRGLINGVGAKVDGLGQAIGKLEAAVGNAVADAAKAVGISEGALAATGRLAGQIVQIFNVIGTIFTILDGMATRVVLGERIDAVEAGLNALGNDVSGILGRLLGLQNRVSRNEASIGEVKTIAIDAKGIGEAARLRAGAAYILAGQAEGIGQQAQKTADGAARNAATANENATTAYKKATNAENIGQQALRVGGDALGKAALALTTALTALSLYQGIKSLRGLQGIPGIPGLKGDKGDQGIPGRDGITTVVTLPGTPGAPGKDGRPGINGFPGRDGRNGVDVNPADIAEIKALIVQQHTQTRGTVTGILAPIITGINNSAGFTQRLITQVAQNTYVEKALSVLTFAATVHNGIMLSSNLGMTLETIINQVLGLVLPKGFDGTPLNVGEIINKSVEELLTEAVGESNYKTISQDWALANRIYAATSNVFNSLTNFTNMIVMGLEVIGGTCAQVGNALKKWGVVGDTAYQFFNPQPNFHNKAFQFLETANADANTILNVVQVPIMVNAAQEQLNQSVTDLNKAIGQAEGAKPGIKPSEAILEKAKADIEKNSSPAIFSVTTDFLQSVDWISNDDGGGE